MDIVYVLFRIMAGFKEMPGLPIAVRLDSIIAT